MDLERLRLSIEENTESNLELLELLKIYHRKGKLEEVLSSICQLLNSKVAVFIEDLDSITPGRQSIFSLSHPIEDEAGSVSSIVLSDSLPDIRRYGIDETYIFPYDLKTRRYDTGRVLEGSTRPSSSHREILHSMGYITIYPNSSKTDQVKEDRNE